MWIHLLSLGLIDGAGGGIEAPKVAGGYDDDEKPKKAKKKFVIEKYGKLLVFNTAQQARNALDAQQLKSKPVEVAAEIVEELQEIALPQMQAVAQVMGQVEEYNSAYNSQHFGALIDLFTRLQAQIQDDEDIELLLLA
jgi:hypothetical protein